MIYWSFSALCVHITLSSVLFDKSWKNIWFDLLFMKYLMKIAIAGSMILNIINNNNSKDKLINVYFSSIKTVQLCVNNFFKTMKSYFNTRKKYRSRHHIFCLQHIIANHLDLWQKQLNLNKRFMYIFAICWVKGRGYPP